MSDDLEPRVGVGEESNRVREPLIFTPTLVSKAAEAIQHEPYSGRLLHRLATRSSEQNGDLLRAQLERAAWLVPPNQRERVLGPFSSSCDDEQVRAAIGTLLIAKTLGDLGWEIDFEPEVDQSTPDLRIRKSNSEYLVEIKRVRETAIDHEQERMIARVRDALKDEQTLTPIFLRSISLSPQASLKRFVRSLRRLWDEEKAVGTSHLFQDDGVAIGFRVPTRFAEPMPAILSWSGGGHIVDPVPMIRRHLNDKLKKYKFPVAVALDFDETYLTDPFSAVEQALYGQEAFQVHVDLADDVESTPPSPVRVRLQNGLLQRRNGEAKRARERLRAVLPFVVRDTDVYQVQARVLANAALDTLESLAEFAPIPRLVVVEERQGQRRLEYLDRQNEVVRENVPSWFHTP